MTYLNGCLKSIVKSEAVTDRGQILYVFFHVGPKEWGIRRTLAISKLYTVGVHVEGSPQVVPAPVDKVLCWVIRTFDMAVKCYPYFLLVTDLGEISMDKWISWCNGIFVGPDRLFQIDVSFLHESVDPLDPF